MLKGAYSQRRSTAQRRFPVGIDGAAQREAAIGRRGRAYDLHPTVGLKWGLMQKARRPAFAFPIQADQIAASRQAAELAKAGTMRQVCREHIEQVDQHVTAHLCSRP